MGEVRALRLILIAIMLVHGLIHLMGLAKAFGYADLKDLKQPIAKPVGLLWLLCAAAFVASAALWLVHQEFWWAVAAPALLISQIVIVRSWGDAKFGTIANLILLLPIATAALEARPASYRNRFRDAVRANLAQRQIAPLVTEADLAPLPAPVQKYLRHVGAVGKPRIENYRATFTGEFRNGFDSRWMSLRAEQYDFVARPARLFLMQASMFGLPAEGLHLYRDGRATMQIKMASLAQVVDASGPKMDQSETVTVFNDLCFYAPTALLDARRVAWEGAEPLAVQARYTLADITIRASLIFNEAGELIDFVSKDRLYSLDGKTYLSYPWSTPSRDYIDVGGRKVASYGEAVWHRPEGPFAYGRFRLTSIDYNIASTK